MYLQNIVFPVLLATLVSSAALPSDQCHGSRYPISDHNIPLYPPLLIFNGVYSADMTLGNQTLRAVIDTGSSDTWLLTQDTNCTDFQTLQAVPSPGQCGYSGPRWNPAGNFNQIPGVNFNSTFGTGENINGPLGYSTVDFGGFNIPKAEISAATYASVGDDPVGNVTGLIGLAYPNATYAFPSTNPSKDVICTDVINATCGPHPYNPLLTTLFNTNQTLPVFAIALSRSTTSGGIMTIGGIPHLHTPTVNATHGAITTVPILPYPNTTIFTQYYTNVDGFKYSNSSSHAGQGQYLLDTGTSINVLPKAEAAAINALFHPPATLNTTLGQYTVPCNATAPELGVRIGGQVFPHNQRDLIIPAGDGGNICFTAIQTSLAVTSLPILGAQFLRNVLVAFDVGRTEMTLWSRVYYEEEK